MIRFDLIWLNVPGEWPPRSSADSPVWWETSFCRWFWLRRLCRSFCVYLQRTRKRLSLPSLYLPTSSDRWTIKGCDPGCIRLPLFSLGLTSVDDPKLSRAEDLVSKDLIDWADILNKDKRKDKCWQFLQSWIKSFVCLNSSFKIIFLSKLDKNINYKTHHIFLYLGVGHWYADTKLLWGDTRQKVVYNILWCVHSLTYCTAETCGVLFF